MDDYLTKPLTKGALIEVVERWGALSADAPVSSTPSMPSNR
jgi:hypothetical protein